MTQPVRVSKREQNLARIRERAVARAEHILLETGLEDLSARRLAADLGVSVGTLYNAFEDLDAVVQALIARSAAMLSDILHRAADPDIECRKTRLKALGEAYFDFAVSEPQRWWLLFEYRSHAEPDARVQEFQTRLLEMLIHVGEGDRASPRHRQIFQQLWASVHGLVSLACRPSIVTINPEDARTYIGDLVETGLAALSRG